MLKRIKVGWYFVGIGWLLIIRFFDMEKMDIRKVKRNDFT